MFVLNPEKNDWNQIKQNDHYISNQEIKRRFGASFCKFSERYILIYGGGGAYIPKIKRRELFDNMFMYDEVTNKIIQLDESEIENYDREKLINEIRQD